MYDISKRVLLIKPTVEALIGILSDLPKDAEVMFCGCDCGYLHVNKESTTICIDSEDLDEDYFNGEEEGEC